LTNWLPVSRESSVAAGCYFVCAIAESLDFRTATARLLDERSDKHGVFTSDVDECSKGADTMFGPW
jgi:hypothetical protein